MEVGVDLHAAGPGYNVVSISSHPNSGPPEDTLLPDPVACVRGSAWWGVVVWVRVVQSVILCATEYRGGRMAL